MWPFSILEGTVEIGSLGHLLDWATHLSGPCIACDALPGQVSGPKYPTINQSLLFHNKAGARTLATKKKTQGALMDPTLSGKIQNTKVRG